MDVDSNENILEMREVVQKTNATEPTQLRRISFLAGREPIRGRQ